jgi:hypothetical protein
MKKGVGSGFSSQRYGSEDPDPQKNYKDLQDPRSRGQLLKAQSAIRKPQQAL